MLWGCYQVALRRFSFCLPPPLVSFCQFFPVLLCLYRWAPSRTGREREGALEASEELPCEGVWSISSLTHSLRLVAALTEGCVIICNERRRILWAFPIASAEQWGPLRGPLLEALGGPSSSTQGAGEVLCEDLVHPEDRKALIKAFEIAGEQRKKKEGQEPLKEGEGQQQMLLGAEKEGPPETPVVLVRSNTCKEEAGGARLFRVSVSGCCGSSSLFVCLWNDATRQRRSAAVQEALVYGLSDCMSTVVWVVDPAAATDQADPATAAAVVREEAAAAAAAVEGAAAASAPILPSGSEIDQGGPSESDGVLEGGDSSSREKTDPEMSGTAYDEGSSGTGMPEPSLFSEGQQQERCYTELAAVSPRLMCSCISRSSSGSNEGEEAAASSSGGASSFLRASSSGVSSTHPAANEPPVAPASLCPSVYQTQLDVVTADREGLRQPPPVSWAGQNPHMHSYTKGFTVEGGAPLLQIEEEGPTSFLLEHSKTILRRLTGHAVAGKEPFSLLAAADPRAPISSNNNNNPTTPNWTDFFLEPGKTQLLECVRRLRTHGTSFSIELPYERSDAEIR